MTFEVEIGVRARIVSVEPAVPGRYRLVVDGRARTLHAARVGGFGLSLLGDGGDSREVHLVPAGPNGEMLALLEGRAIILAINGRRLGRRAGDAGSHAGDQIVSAPMPGRVVRVLVGPGDEVKARQPVVVVEAMKMENELRAPRAGTVRDVTVSPGMSVERGRALVTIG